MRLNWIALPSSFLDKLQKNTPQSQNYVVTNALNQDSENVDRRDNPLTQTSSNQQKHNSKKIRTRLQTLQTNFREAVDPAINRSTFELKESPRNRSNQQTINPNVQKPSQLLTTSA